MPAHLTRLVIRRILSNEPIVYRDCLYRRANACLRPRSQISRRNGLAQTRSFFGFARESSERKVKEADLAPGLEDLIALKRAKVGRLRPPELKTLRRALTSLVKSKVDTNDSFSDVEADHFLNTLRYLDSEHYLDNLAALETEEAHVPQNTVLIPALDTLAGEASPRSASHLALAEELFRFTDAGWSSSHERTEPYSPRMFEALSHTVVAMALNGEPARARDLLVSKYKERGWPHSKDSVNARPWVSILEQYHMNGDEAGAQHTLQTMQELELHPGVMRKTRDALLGIHAKRGDLEAAKEVYKEIPKGADGIRYISTISYQAMLKCCLQHDDSEWAQSLVRSMLETLEVYYSRPASDRLRPAKQMWDALFLWAAGSGKGVDEVDRMISVMVRRTFADGSSAQPDVETINTLVESCMARNEAYFAERYISLGSKWGIHPNAETYYLQVSYRLSSSDIDGARAAYKLLQAESCSKGEDSRAANKLIQAMCASRKYRIDTIMALVDDLNERKARFDPETVSALTLLHLQRNELRDVIDLLQTHAYHFSTDERLAIADTLVSIIMDRAHSSVTRAWDTYIITHSIFMELPREKRTAIMREFFARDRADMACHVFAHMRELEHDELRATADTYVAVLTGIAEYAAAETAEVADADVLDDEDDMDADRADQRNAECRRLLDVVHNAMKLDLDIEPSTRLRNALMLAFTACGQPVRAWGFWEDIVNSREGPSFNSIPIAFRTCERMPVGGERHARELWARLRNMDVEISKETLAAYVGALAGSQNVGDAQSLLLSAEKEFGWRPDAFMLGTLYNAAYGVARQEEIERWIQAKFPIQWVELQRIGARKMEDGPRLFNIDRSLAP